MLNHTLRLPWTIKHFRQELAAKRFKVLYQPQVASDDKRLCGAEALVRYLDEDGRVCSPAYFIGELERLGVIGELTEYVFDCACNAAARWPMLSIAVNVSPVEFKDPSLIDRLSTLTERAGVNPSRLEIEITEGLFFEDEARAEMMLRAFRERGFSIALDDFGTGYSSLAYLMRFPVDKIKIDQSFVKDIPQSMKAASIIHALIALSRAIGLRVVAEGIETEEQRIFLRTARCHLLQGYLFAKPLSVSEMDEALGMTAYNLAG